MEFRNNETTKKIEVIITDQETEKINLVLAQIKNNLNFYIENEREDFYFEVSQFLTNEAIKNELLNKRYHIINDLDYNKEFESIIHLNNGFLEFVKNDLLYQFIIAYNVLEDISRGERVLKNILRVKLINWLIENDFKDNNRENFVFRVPENISTIEKKFNDKIFKSYESEILFYSIVNSKDFDWDRKYLNAFYHWFSKHIKRRCSRYVFANFWNSLNLKHKINTYEDPKSADIVPYEDEDLINEFEHIKDNIN